MKKALPLTLSLIAWLSLTPGFAQKGSPSTSPAAIPTAVPQPGAPLVSGQQPGSQSAFKKAGHKLARTSKSMGSRLVGAGRAVSRGGIPGGWRY